MATVKERHPEVYRESNEDPRKRTRTVPMEVLSLGMSRTGTMSMKAAFETLGIPSWHWVTMSENPADMDLWIDALRGKFEPEESGIQPFGRAEFDNLLGHWGATTDQPQSFFARELVEAYPDAKVILIERDIDRWYTSFENTVIAGTANPFIPLASKIDKKFIGKMAILSDLIAKHLFNVSVPRTCGFLGLFNNPEFFAEWRRNAKVMYLAHNENVKRVTPKDRILIFDLNDGWDPLCSHLGKPLPGVPFPKVNETAAVNEKINAYLVQGYKRSAKNFAIKALPVVAIMIAAGVWWAQH